MPAAAQSVSRFHSSIVVGTVSGDVPSPSSAFVGDLTPRRFRDVLQNALEGAQLGARGSSGRYRIDAHLEHVDYPSGTFIPLAVIVRSIVRYSVVDLATGREVFKTRADESAMVTRLQVPDEFARANTAIRRSAQNNAARLVTSLNDPNKMASRQ